MHAACASTARHTASPAVGPYSGAAPWRRPHAHTPQEAGRRPGHCVHWPGLQRVDGARTRTFTAVARRLWARHLAGSPHAGPWTLPEGTVYSATAAVNGRESLVASNTAPLHYFFLATIWQKRHGGSLPHPATRPLMPGRHRTNAVYLVLNRFLTRSSTLSWGTVLTLANGNREPEQRFEKFKRRLPGEARDLDRRAPICMLKRDLAPAKRFLDKNWANLTNGTLKLQCGYCAARQN